MSLNFLSEIYWREKSILDNILIYWDAPICFCSAIENLVVKLQVQWTADQGHIHKDPLQILPTLKILRNKL